LADTCIDSDAVPAKEEDLGEMRCLLLGCAPDNGMGTDGFPQCGGLLLVYLPDGTFIWLGPFRQDLDRESWMDDEVSFDEYYTDLEGNHSLGSEARFSVEGSWEIVVII